MYKLKENKKTFVTLLLASALLSSLFLGVAFGFINGQSAVAPWNADYVTLEGVAANDYYSGDSSRQYSYNINQWALDYEQIPGYPALDPDNTWFTAGKSLRWGMTEFGEFATPANTGIAYGASSTEWTQTESWSAATINPSLYIQGWTFYMNYTRAGVLRCIESYALYSDMMSVEAGRKTVSWDGTQLVTSTSWAGVTGTITASGIKMLYDSARLAVARATVTIKDNYYNENVANITFTVILNKDTKYAIIYKDIKILIDPKVLDFISDLAFSERYEIDLARGVNPSNQAYVHWFKDYNQTTYMHPLTGDEEFDVVQAFDINRQYIFFAAYWPNTTECSVYSPLVPDLGSTASLRNTRVLAQGTKILDVPAPINEPNTPWIIAQWRYQAWNPVLKNYFPKMLHFLAKDPQREIRFVEVAGMTDYNEQQPVAFQALDINATDPTNTVDVEVRFLLANVFNPQSLGNTLEEVPDEPFMWVGLGQSAATTDSAGGVAISDFVHEAWNEPLGLFDRNDTMFPWTGGFAMKGTIPFGLEWTGNFAPNYVETFSNFAKSTGVDATLYKRTALNGFAFKIYDGEGTYSPQPIAGGWSQTGSYWYPSKNPLNERWLGDLDTLAPYYDEPDNGIITIGGMKANGLSRYFNDFNFALQREGTVNFAFVNSGTVTPTASSAPTSDGNKDTIDFFPLGTWNSSASTFGYKEGYAIIAVGRDINGTRGLTVNGWDGRDTYWATNWASQFLMDGMPDFNAWLPEGAVAVILNISYSAADREPIAFTVVKVLGTITEFGENAFFNAYGYDLAAMGAIWNGNIDLSMTLESPTYPANQYAKQWWYAKLPTITIAKVDFDP